jgi:hypothetical protein
MQKNPVEQINHRLYLSTSSHETLKTAHNQTEIKRNPCDPNPI